MDVCTPDVDWGCVDATWVDGLDPLVKKRSEALAWSTLQALVGYAVAVCPIMVRPCAQRCLDAARTWEVAPEVWGGGSFFPGINSQGMWINSCGCGPRDCSCERLEELVLVGPIGGIVEIRQDGSALDPSAYRVDSGNRVVRVDGGSWPACQDIAGDPATDENTLSVVYYQGNAPTALTEYAAGVLAAEYAKACLGERCRLPDGVTQITRDGVSMSIEPNIFQSGITGIHEVDAVIGMLNPHGLKQPSRFMSPDYRRPRTVTFPHG